MVACLLDTEFYHGSQDGSGFLESSSHFALTSQVAGTLGVRRRSDSECFCFYV